MSRIGKKEIKLPANVEITIQDSAEGQAIGVKGPKGELNRVIRPEVNVTKEGDTLLVKTVNDDRKSRSLHGLYRTLLSNMVLGVSEGFKKELDIVGVGYRAILKGSNLDFQIGKSHPVIVEPPNGIQFTVEENNTRIIISGYDKELVGQVAANIRSIREPEPYKGKGIKYRTERIRRKAGKSGAAK